jgi:hypothetical protein
MDNRAATCCVTQIFFCSLKCMKSKLTTFKNTFVGIGRTKHPFLKKRTLRKKKKNIVMFSKCFFFVNLRKNTQKVVKNPKANYKKGNIFYNVKKLETSCSFFPKKEVKKNSTFFFAIFTAFCFYFLSFFFCLFTVSVFFFSV